MRKNHLEQEKYWRVMENVGDTNVSLYSNPTTGEVSEVAAIDMEDYLIASAMNYCESAA